LEELGMKTTWRDRGKIHSHPWVLNNIIESLDQALPEAKRWVLLCLNTTDQTPEKDSNYPFLSCLPSPQMNQGKLPGLGYKHLKGKVCNWGEQGEQQFVNRKGRGGLGV
jgi:hypothetical protein